MTTNIEQKFFEVFGIEKKLETKALCLINELATCEQCVYYKNGKCKSKKQYTQITSDILLGLICILSSKVFYKIELSVVDREDLKECLLQESIDIFKRPHIHYKKREKIKKLVQSLFTEVQNELQRL